IENGQTVGLSGFTVAGTPHAIPRALAGRAEQMHREGMPFKIGLVTGASTGPWVDGALSRANALLFRTPYQSDPHLRECINSGDTHFYDMHLSSVPQNLRYGFLGKISWAIIEAAEISEDGYVTLTNAVGIAPTLARVADKVFIELNSAHSAALQGFHDLYEPFDPPFRREIPLYAPQDRIGTRQLRIDPAKIAGIVATNHIDDSLRFESPSLLTTRIGENVADFLASEGVAGRLSLGLLPLQSGVGDIANAVLAALGNHPAIPRFTMYTEVIQDSVVRLIETDRIRFASGCSLTVSGEVLRQIYSKLDRFRERLVLRPQEISNHPEVVRRLGLISVNTPIEADFYGNVNSTHVMGASLVNGIGGSGDFTRNAFLSIFAFPSTAKEGRISTIVPLVTHVDHSEHSVQVIVTEQGVADLRGKDPHERARLIISKCAHPRFRDELASIFRASRRGHVPFALSGAFAMHERFLETGDMHRAAQEPLPV
ncbi:MAG TPA: succinate CoA transferase, partial [Opitutaceae bacterium]